jgi:hypothetical protein
MKTRLQTTLFLLILSAVVASVQPAGAGINPATGLPDASTPDSGPALHLNLPIDPNAGRIANDQPPFLPPPRYPLEDGPFDLPAPGEKPDFNKILSQAAILTRKGRYDEALQHLVWYYSHSETDPSQQGVRVSFALHYWDDLGSYYPKAMQALVEIRDEYTQRLLKGHGSAGLFQDVVAINQHLESEEDTYTLFKSIEHQDPKLAGRCYFYVENQLVRKGEFETCRKYIGDPSKDFQKICQRYDQGLSDLDHFIEMRQKAGVRQKKYQQKIQLNRQIILTNVPVYTSAAIPAPTLPSIPDPSGMLKKSVEDRFVGEISDLMEILAATGSQSDAENIRNQALTVLDDPRLESTVNNAKAK